MYHGRIILTWISFILSQNGYSSGESRQLFGNVCNTKAVYFPGEDTVVSNGNTLRFVNESINAVTYTWFIDDLPISSGVDLDFNPRIGVNKIMLVASNGNCRDSTFSYVIWDGNLPGQYDNLQKQYNPPGKAMEPFCMAKDKSDGYLLAGNYYSPSENQVMIRTSSLIHIDEKACVDWARSFTEREPQVIQAILSTSDSGYLITAFPFQSQLDNYPNELHIFKLDKSGNKLWARSFSNGTNVNNYYSAICETNDNGFVIEVGSFSQGASTSSISLMKIDQSGGFIWGRNLGMEGNAVYNIGGVLEKENLIYATGSIYQGSAPFGLLRSFLIQLDETTGVENWTKKNDPSYPPLTFTDIHNYHDSLLINSYTETLLNSFIFLDYNGKYNNSLLVNNPYGSLNGKGNILVCPDNGIYFHQSSGISGLKHKDIIMRLNGDKKIDWQYDFSTSVLNLSGWNQLSTTTNNGVSGIGTSKLSNGNNTLTFLKLDAMGNGCNAGASDFQLEDNQVSLVPMVWATNSSISFKVIDIPLDLNQTSIDSRLVCPKYIVGCDLLKLEAPSRVCRPGDTVKILVHADKYCTDPITWTYDQQSVKVLDSSQSILEIIFLKAGVFEFKVAKNGCNRIEDSILVSAGNDKTGMSLPTDTSLCIGYSILLDPGNGYDQYLWQDGSDKESFLVANSGLYWVKLTDAAGCIQTDSIFVNPAKGLPSSFLPNDTVICEGEILNLKPFQPYKTYKWNTGETESTIKIKLPGIYTLQVVDQFGCMGAASILVKTRACPEGLYFSNAFTPNSDGLNDVFKPTIFIKPKDYELKIFNRWGQLVFETKNPETGWNGRIGNKDQETGTYVWFCTYQFEGENRSELRGAVILLR